MPLPASFNRDGFLDPKAARQRRWLPGLKRPGIMIGTEGETNTGKSEFAMSAPDPNIMLCVDRMVDAVFDNPVPPKDRRSNIAIKEIKLATATMAEDFKENWASYYKDLMRAIGNPDVRTVTIDGDSDTWETQRLAEFGKLTQIPSILYTNVNAARRALIARLYDSGKIIIATNKLREEYVIDKDEQGNPKLNKDGKESRIKSGRLIRQGFEDDNYIWHIQLRHLRKDTVSGPVFGIEILKCKSNPGLIGTELWSNQGECNFATLVQYCYPHVALKEWGL